jgi:hypothetical protein
MCERWFVLKKTLLKPDLCVSIVGSFDKKKLETHASHNIKKSGHGELLELRLLEKSA